MICLILFLVYILSIVLMRYAFRYCSSKHADVWLDEDCRISFLWFIPLVNTLGGIMILLFAYRDTKVSKLPKSKWFNTDF